MREIESVVDLGRIFVSEVRPTAADVRLVVEGWSSSDRVDITLNVKARRELIEALTATLPKEGANGSFLALDSVDEDASKESYCQWRREVGVPVPGEEA